LPTRASPSDYEEIDLERTKEALTFKWYEEPEEWDRLCPGEDVADMADMETRHRELYLSFLRLDKLKKMTMTKNNEKISSNQKKKIQDENSIEYGLRIFCSHWPEMKQRITWPVNINLNLTW
jgi:hypothetical protein